MVYQALTAYWWIRNPHVRSAQLVLVAGEEVLLVRHAYREPSTWMVPGGAVRRGEEFRAAAVREADEELGVSLSDVTLLLSYTVFREHKHDEVTAFLAEVPRDADVVIDRGELLEARWWPLRDLPRSLDENDGEMLETVPARRRERAT